MHCSRQLRSGNAAQGAWLTHAGVVSAQIKIDGS
jgi:hypothetical protein